MQQMVSRVDADAAPDELPALMVGCDATGRVLLIGRGAGLDQKAHPGSQLVAFLQKEDRALATAQAAREIVAHGFGQAMEDRAGATAHDDLAAIDTALYAAAQRLSAGQRAVLVAELAVEQGEAELHRAYRAAEDAARERYGARGQVWLDGKTFAVRQGDADQRAEARLAKAAHFVERARSDEGFAALAALFVDDPTDTEAVAAAMAAREGV